MQGRTLARNHLSALANKGRYGDTKIAESKFVKPGALWHVNEGESKAMSMYGAEGEKLVDAVGSGTRNPETGLEEKFIPALIAAAPAIATGLSTAASVIGAGLGVASAVTGSREKKSQGRYEERAADQGLERLGEASASLDATIGAKRASAQQDYQMQVESMSAQTGIRKEDLQKQTQQAIQQSGMASSGTVEGGASSMWDRIQSSHEAGREGLTAKLGKAMGDIEGWYEGEKARIKSETQKFENQKKLAQEQQKGLFG